MLRDGSAPLSAYALNGRHIKNAMRIACAVASSARRPLSFEDVDAAASIAHRVNLDLQVTVECPSEPQSRQSNDPAQQGHRRKRVELDVGEGSPRVRGRFAAARTEN